MLIIIWAWTWAQCFSIEFMVYLHGFGPGSDPSFSFDAVRNWTWNNWNKLLSLCLCATPMFSWISKYGPWDHYLSYPLNKHKIWLIMRYIIYLFIFYLYPGWVNLKLRYMLYIYKIKFSYILIFKLRCTIYQFFFIFIYLFY